MKTVDGVPIPGVKYVLFGTDNETNGDFITDIMKNMEVTDLE